MSTLFERFRYALRHDGAMHTAARVFAYPLNRLKQRRLHDVMPEGSAEETFTWIYRNNHWSSPESPSGRGSTLERTGNLRRELPALLRRHAIRTIFDAPCGDFHWMRHLLATIDVGYIGGDIVRPLVESHQRLHANASTAFLHLDLTRDAFPRADLMICRDCLFHLSYEDTRSVLRNFVESGIPYLLTTTHTDTGRFRNRDIRTGGFRLMDLCAAPYNFPLDPLEAIDDWVPPDPERRMCLWTREQVAGALAGFTPAAAPA